MIELLMVMAILAILAGVLMPVVQVARRASLKSASLSVMHKTDAAIRLFHAEMGVFPYQQTYADLDGNAPWTNNLYYNVGTKIAPADLANLYADAGSAASQYNYTLAHLWNGVTVENPPASIQAYRAADVVQANREDMDYNADITGAMSNNMGSAIILNRMARERARMAIFSGNTGVCGVTLPGGRTAATTTTPLVSAPVSAGKPGWADDYLDGNIEKRFLNGGAILDAYKHPLIYVCQVTEGVRSPRSPVVLDNFTAIIDQATYHFTTAGRTILAATDPDAGAALQRPDGTSALPDHAVLRHSDRRYYSAAGYEDEFELWSAGADGVASWWRDDRRNDDNVGLMDYDRTIP
jgi:type II secretory pathway pseudopilin PulG